MHELPDNPVPPAFSEREISLLLETLSAEEQKFIAQCLEKKIVQRADVAAVLENAPLDGSRPQIGNLMVQAGKISSLEFRALWAKTFAAPLSAIGENISLGNRASVAAESPHPDADAAGQVPPASRLASQSTPSRQILPTVDYTGPNSPGSKVLAKATDGGLQPGTLFGTYRILGVLGTGGMGVVYVARQEGLDRTVCLKTLLPEFGQEKQQQRLLQEARALARLSHPNIVPIYDIGHIEGQHFYTMEYIRGCSLDRALSGTSMDPKVVARLVRDVAQGLQCAHEHGVVHRDIKPSNLLLQTDVEEGPVTSEDWQQLEVKIVDFGLARQVNRLATRLTQQQAVVGTPMYMSPEQARGEINKVDARSDVFSLGLVLYELLTGMLPYAGLPTNMLLRKLAETSEPLLPPSRIFPEVDPLLEAICVKSIRKDPNQRYATAAALAEDLDRYLNGQKISAKRPSIFERRGWRKKWVATAALVTVLLLSGGGHYAANKYWEWSRSRPSESNKIDYTAAIDHLGEYRTVQGTIVRAIQDVGGITFLFDHDFNSKQFALFCPDENKSPFPTGFEDLYYGKRLLVAGKILSQNGRPEIILQSPSQILLLGTAEVPKPNEKNLVNWVDAGKHIGEVMTVEGNVISVKKLEALTFLEFAIHREGSTDFRAVIFPEDWKRFGDIAQTYTGTQVRIAGRIESFKGIAEMVLTDPAQIQIVGAAASLRPDAKNLVNWTEAGQHIGEIKTVEGIIVGVKKLDTIAFLDFAPYHEGSTDLEIVIPASSFNRFGDIAQTYSGKQVWVVGDITRFKTHPEIDVTDPAQIQIVGAVSLRPDAKNKVKWTEAEEHIGEVITVEGKLVNVKMLANRAFLQFAPYHDGSTELELVIPAGSFNRFEDIVETYSAKQVCAIGKIQRFKTHIQMEITDPAQIQIGGGGNTLRPDAKNLVNWTEAGQHIGEIKTVEGNVVSVKKMPNLAFLQFAPYHEGSADLELVIPASSFNRFGDIVQTYSGKQLWAVGEIKRFKSQTEIEITDPAQIQIVDATAKRQSDDKDTTSPP